MSAMTMIVELLNDAEHIAKANSYTVLAYLIGMAKEHAVSDLKSGDVDTVEEEPAKATGT